MQTLSSKQNGIAGVAPRLCTTALATQRRATAAVVEVECADGRRGGKLKTRKVRLDALAWLPFVSLTNFVSEIPCPAGCSKEIQRNWEW